MSLTPTCLTKATILILAIILGGCDQKTKEPEGSAKVSLATGKNVWCSLLLVAEEKGYFEKEGLDLTLNFQDAGRYCMDALLSKSVDFAAVVEANVGYIGFTGNKSPRVIAQIVASSCGIIARRSNGIEKESDLRGKRIAYVPATGAEPFLYRFLEKHNIPLQEVTLRKMQPKALQPALVAGDIDAAATWEPFIYNCMKAMKGDAVEFRDPNAFTGYMMLAARQEWISENKATVQAVLRALHKAEEYVANHPTETQALLAQMLDMDIKDVQGIWPYFEIKLRMDKQALLQAIRFVGENARATDSAFADKKLPDYNEYVDESYFPLSQ